MIDFDYKARISSLRKNMESLKIDAIVFPTDANMEYFTSIPRQGSWTTKQRQNSSDYSCVLITDSDVIIFLPSLTYIVTMSKLQDRQIDARFVVFEDGDLSGKALVDEFQKQKLFRKKIGVAMDLSAPLLVRMINDMKNDLFDMTPVLKKNRSIKDEKEIACMKEASRRTDLVYKELISQICIGASVQELELELERLILKYGGTASSFQGELNNHGPLSGPMVGYSYPTIEKGYVLGLDFGMIYQGYCTDFGRTVFVGEPSREIQKMYETVVHAQKAAIDCMTEKVSCQEVDEAARKTIAEEGYSERFIHKLGHGVGMDVHEEPFLCKGERKLIESGMVFAVEPSIFIPQKCFVRVEDLVEVTDNGCQRMSEISQNICVVEA